MTTLLVIIWFSLLAILTTLLAIYPARTSHSRFELSRLHDESTLRRERLLGSIYATLRTIVLLVVATLAAIAVVLWGGWSALVILLVPFIVIPLARLRTVRQSAQRLYARYEPSLLRFIDKNPWTGWLMLPADRVPRDQKLESTEQLLHLAQASPILSEEQLAIIQHGLSWHTTTVGEVMVPRTRITSVKHSELLGPLVLDDFHKTGHNQFPVTKGSIDTIVGLLSITELLDVTAGRITQTAEKVMSTQVVRVAANEPLPQALTLLQKSKQHMLIVVDEDGNTAGLLTLADITGSLLGKTGVR